MRYFKTKRLMALLMCMLLAVGVVFTGNIVLGAENSTQPDISKDGSVSETAATASDAPEAVSEMPATVSEMPQAVSEEAIEENISDTYDITDAVSEEEAYAVSDVITENLVVTSSLVIDGYYADWDKYPTTNITYMSNNGIQVHTGKIYSDGEMVYVHFSMNDLYTSQVMMQQMTITVNGQSHAIGLYALNADKSINWGFPMYNLPEGIHTNFGVIVDYTKYCDSQGAITVYDASHSPDTKGDEVEFAFSIEDFCRITGMNTDSFGNITIVNPNIGSQGVVWAGTPTGIVMGMTAAVVFALLGYSLNKKNRKQENV